MAISEAEQVALLTGPDARALISAALETEGSELLEWAVHALHHRPGAGVSAGYTVTVRTRSGATQEQYVCASTGRITNPNSPGLVRLDHPTEDVAVHVWRHPNDPELPALGLACDPEQVSELLGQPVSVAIVSYRPTRRCVVRAMADDAPVAFLKVVRPRTLPDLVRRHEVLADAGVPAPRITRVDERGLVALTAATGRPMARYLSAGLTDDIATLESVVGVLDDMPAAVLELPRHPSWSERVDYYGHAAATALPGEAERARAIVATVNRMMLGSDPGPLVPTHGDFYEANIFMSSETDVSSLLDVDAVGPGYRVDDLACLLGHVSVLPCLAPASYTEVPHNLVVWWEHLVTQVDRTALAARAAAVTLSLVAGAKKTHGEEWRRDALDRLAQAEHWLTLG